MRDYGRDLYILAIDGNLCKIGRSSNCERRLKEVRAYMPWLVVELVAVLPDAGWLEGTLHGAFQSRKVGREWFRIGKEEAIEAAEMNKACLSTVFARRSRPKPRHAESLTGGTFTTSD